MATKTTKSEDKSVLRKALAALAVALGLEAPQPVNYELNTESGDTITIDKPDGEDPAVGDSASPDGEHKMPDGKTIVIEDGKITEIRDAEDEGDGGGDGGDGSGNDPDSDALAAANARIAELETELADARKNAKTTDEKRILSRPSPTTSPPHVKPRPQPQEKARRTPRNRSRAFSNASPNSKQHIRKRSKSQTTPINYGKYRT